MRRLIYLASIFITICFIVVKPIHGAELTQVLVRFDQSQAATNTSGLICAKPTTNDTEQSVQIQFPVGFNVSNTLTNWSVATDQILTGATAWPGIGQATNVSGQTVTFPSGNLNPATLYCFRWTDSAALQTGTTGDAIGRITTKNGLNATIDSSEFAITLRSNDQLSVTGTIPANPSDFEATISSPTTGSPFPQNQTINYSISYGSHLAYNSNITVEAEWDSDVVDYVIASASNGYNNTPPVIDTLNKKISWTINSFPSNTTNQVVTFQLKTNDSYTGLDVVNFSVKARVLGPGTQTPDSIIAQSYHYVQLNPTATPTPAPNPTATPEPGITATPAPSTIPLSINDISLQEITSTTANIDIITSDESSIKLRYGVDLGNLDQLLQSLNYQKKHLIQLSQLKPGTNYYFKVSASNRSGKTVTSDYFVFRTALGTQKFEIGNNLIITSDNLIISTGISKNIVVPRNKSFTISIRPDNWQTISTITGSLKNSKVLGISVFNQINEIEKETKFIETLPGEFSAQIQIPQLTGEYQLVLKVQDIYGGFYTKTLPFNIFVSDPITIFNKDTHEPVENALVKISRFEDRLKQFTFLGEGFNFSYQTDEKGQLDITLPSGIYLLEISAAGYHPTTIRYELGLTDSENSYPQAFLQKSNNVIDTITYYTTSFGDVKKFSDYYIQNFFSSGISKNASLLLIQLIIIFLILSIISTRLNLGIFGLLLYLLESVYQRFKHLLVPGTQYKSFLIFENIRYPKVIPGAMFYIMNAQNHLLFRKKTNPLGLVTIPEKIFSQAIFPLKCFLYRPGYYAYPINLDKQSLKQSQIKLMMEKDTVEVSTIASFFEWIFQIVWIVISDTLIVSVLVFSYFFVKYQGFSKSEYILLFAGISVILWLWYMKKIWQLNKTL